MRHVRLPYPSQAENDQDLYLVFEFMETDLHAVRTVPLLHPPHGHASSCLLAPLLAVRELPPPSLPHPSSSSSSPSSPTPTPHPCLPLASPNSTTGAVLRRR